MATSTTGPITSSVWTDLSSTVKNNLFCFGNGIYASTEYYSYNATSWYSTNKATSNLTNIGVATYGNGMFVAPATNGILYSYDGMNWFEKTVSYDLGYIGATNDKFIAITRDGKSIIIYNMLLNYITSINVELYSEDVTELDYTHVIFVNNGPDIGSICVIGVEYSNIIYYSYNSIDWLKIDISDVIDGSTEYICGISTHPDAQSGKLILITNKSMYELNIGYNEGCTKINTVGASGRAVVFQEDNTNRYVLLDGMGGTKYSTSLTNNSWTGFGSTVYDYFYIPYYDQSHALIISTLLDGEYYVQRIGTPKYNYFTTANLGKRTPITSSISLGASYSFNVSASGNGIFVGLSPSSLNTFYYDGNNSSIILSSTNKLSKTGWSAACFGNDKFVAVSSTSNVIAYSTDGKVWTEVTVTYSNWTDIRYNPDNKIYVAINNSGYIMTSSDAVTWTDITSLNTSTSLTSGWNNIYYAAGKYIATNNGAVYVSESIADWSGYTKTVISSGSTIYDICYGSGKFVLICGTTIRYSYDAITWTTVSISSRSISSIAYGGGMFFVTGNSYYAYSYDAIRWTWTGTTRSLGRRSLSYALLENGNGSFIAISSSYAYIMKMNVSNYTVPKTDADATLPKK